MFKPESSPGVFRPVRKYEPMTSFMAIIGCLAAFQVRRYHARFNACVTIMPIWPHYEAWI